MSPWPSRIWTWGMESIGSKTERRLWTICITRASFINPEDSPRPDLILLDLRLPVIDGHEVLKAAKESCELRAIPVVILTSSQNKADINRAYSNHANSYLVKPMSSDTLVKMIGSLGVYWLKWNRNPG